MTKIPTISTTDQRDLNLIAEFVAEGNLKKIKSILSNNKNLLNYPQFGVADLGSLLHAAAAAGQLPRVRHFPAVFPFALQSRQPLSGAFLDFL